MRSILEGIAAIRVLCARWECQDGVDRVPVPAPLDGANASRRRGAAWHRSRDYERRRGGYSPHGSPRSASTSRGINDRWRHDKFEEEEEKRLKYCRLWRDRARDWLPERSGGPTVDMGAVITAAERYEDEEMDDEAPPRRDFSPGRRKKFQKPTNIIYVKVTLRRKGGLPTDVTEAEVYNMIESLNASFTIQAIRLGRDRLTGASRGFGFIEFPTIEDSRKFMESPAAADLRIRQHPLWTNYSSAPTPGHRFGHEGVHMDWMCNMCSAINFARRLECYQCCAPRGKDVQRVTNEPMGPSNILKVSSLDPQTSESDLHALFTALVPVKEIRMVMDKFTNAPRGFAFIHFFSVADASRAMNTYQGHVTEKQRTPIKLFYAKDRVPPTATGTAAAAAIEAAQAMQQYNATWEPKEFDEAAAEVKDEAVGDQQTAAASHDLGGGFVYHAQSGYYYHEATGYYYDATTGMYYNGASGEWLSYDQGKNAYVPYTAPQPVTSVTSVPVEQPPAVAKDAVESAPAKVAKPTTTAVIGAKPKLNPPAPAPAPAEEEAEKAKRAASLRQLQKEKEQRAVGAEKLLGNAARATAALKKSAKAATESLKKDDAAAPRVKGVIRGGKWSGANI